MFKFAVIVSLMLVGSSMWAASLSCDSCGSECASACGTRHFRSCCFNYLRRKRGPDPLVKFIPQNSNVKSQAVMKIEKQKFPFLLVDNIPDQWANVIANEYRPYLYEDMIQNRFFEV